MHGRLLGYQVEYRRVEAGYLNTWKTITVGANDYEATITDLKKYGAYAFQVGGFTRKGRGTLSKAYMIRTDEDGTWLNFCLFVIAIVTVICVGVDVIFSERHDNFYFLFSEF